MTQRLLELAIDQHGEPPVAYAWLAFGSAARSELNLVSDQDNGLAYDDTDDPSVEEYFRVLAEDVNEGLRRCGFALDVHGTVASNWQWRLPLSKWCAVFSRSLEGKDLDRLARASVGFDFRQIAGDLPVAPALTDIIRRRPSMVLFMSGLAALGTKNPSALTLLQRLPAHHRHQERGPAAAPEPDPLPRLRSRDHGAHHPRAAGRHPRGRRPDRRVGAAAARGVPEHAAPAAAPSRPRPARRSAARQHHRHRRRCVR
jgi:hypothetical protein